MKIKYRLLTVLFFLSLLFNTFPMVYALEDRMTLPINRSIQFTAEEVLSGSVSAMEWDGISYYLRYISDEDQVPLLFQTDYPDIPFSEGTVYTSGCGVSCAAMVGSYFHNEIITPGELGQRFNTPGYSNAQRMEQAIEYMSLPLKEVSWNIEDAYEALENGQVVISLQVPGLFTSIGHFIVLTGLNEYGLIMVNDPYEPHYYSNEERMEGFENGFTKEQIEGDGSCFWIFEKKAPPQTEVIGTEEELDQIKELLENGLCISVQ